MSKNKKTKTKTQKRKPNQPEVIFIKNYYQYFLLILIMAYFVHLCLKVGFIQDDTYITLQYAKNFADGNGFVFNVGQRVEGFTSLVWVLLLSILYKIGFNIENSAQNLSITFGAISLIVTYFVFYEVARNKSAENENKNILKLFAVISVFITALSGTYYYWSVSGMETSLFTLFVLITVYVYLKYYLNGKFYITLPILISVTSLIRPEGNLLFALILLHLFFKNLIETKFNLSQTLKSVFKRKRTQGYLVFIILLGAMTIFRIFYFGYPLPNTFYAKTTFSFEQLRIGFKYFISFASDYLLYGVLLIAPLYLFRYKEKLSGTSFLFLIVWSFIFYTIFIGGDVLTQFRFFVPVLPLISILFCLVFYYISTILKVKERKTSLPMLFIIPLASAVFIYVINSDTVKNIAEKEKDFVETMKYDGLWLREQQKLGDHKITVAASTIGALAYFSDVNVLDMLGLTEPYIAHNPEMIANISSDEIGWKEKKYNAKYVLSKNPDYILFSTQEKPSSYAERALFTQNDFHANYFIYVYDPDASKIYQSIYKMRDNILVPKKEIINHNPDFSIKYIAKYNQIFNMTSLSNKKLNVLDFINESKELVRISPSYFGDAYRLLGWAYMGNGNRDEAIASFEEAIKIDKVNLKASTLLTQLYMSKNDFESADREIKTLENIVPAVGRTLRNGMLKKQRSLKQ